MSSPAGGRDGVKYGGFAVAIVGFLLTRFTVLAAVRVHDTLLAFLLAESLPLVLGLGLSVFGVGLAVSTLDRRTVNTVTAWCLIGTVAMLLIVGITFLESLLYGRGTVFDAQTSGLVTNTLIGGAVGGTLVGLRSASNRRQRRELARQSDRATVLNRLLRHEVLNAVMIIRGHARSLLDRDGDAAETIVRNADRVEEAVRDVGFLTPEGTDTVGPVELGPSLRAAVEGVRAEHEGIEFVTPDAADIEVRATDRLGTVLELLIEGVVTYSDGVGTVEIGIERGQETVSIRVGSDGGDLPERQTALLTHRTLPEYDDPTTGFDFPMARLLAEEFGGAVDASESSVAVELPAGDAASEDEQYGVATTRLRNAALAALVAGVVMGAVIQILTGAIPIIGALYGVNSLGVGWLTHFFHSVVFGVLFVAALSRPTFSGLGDSPGWSIVAGIGYGVLLWLVAAGVIMPVWLNAVGVPTPVPNLQPGSLVGHVVWGAILGNVVYSLPD